MTAIDTNAMDFVQHVKLINIQVLQRGVYLFVFKEE